jgi:amino acid permease
MFCRFETCYHNVTAMVGAGVLGLPHAFASLGWGGGIAVLLVSLVISWYTFGLLVYMHEVRTSGAGARRLLLLSHVL